MEFLMNLKFRLAIAFLIGLITCIYFITFKNFNNTSAHIIYFVIILALIVTAFMTKNRDVTIGILYGLILVLVSLLFVFTFMKSLL
jgi:Ca2+/Na+ antiporter